jgi:hypothetical protein
MIRKPVFQEDISQKPKNDFDKVDLNVLPEGFNWMHLSGITPHWV